MQNIIYIVKAKVGYDYESSNESNIFTSFNKDEAVNFADKYHKNNIVSATVVADYDYLTVEVTSLELGVAGTEILVWTSYKTDKKFCQIGKNLSLPLDFKEEEIQNHIKNLSNPRFPMMVFVVNPTLGDIVNNNDIQPEFSSDLFDQFTKFIGSDLENLYSRCINQNQRPYNLSEEVEIIDDSKDWDLYNQFERNLYH